MDCNDYCDLLEMELKCDLLLNVNSNMTELLLSLLIDSHFFYGVLCANKELEQRATCFKQRAATTQVYILSPFDILPLSFLLEGQLLS